MYLIKNSNLLELRFPPEESSHILRDDIKNANVNVNTRKYATPFVYIAKRLIVIFYKQYSPQMIVARTANFHVVALAWKNNRKVSLAIVIASRC